MKHSNTFILTFCSIFASCSTTNTKMNNTIHEPVAKISVTNLEKHGDIRTDNYYWLNQRENPEVIAYLEEENNYYNTSTAHTKDFQQDLFEEMKSRIKEDDSSVPYFYNGYWYLTRFEKG